MHHPGPAAHASIRHIAVPTAHAVPARSPTLPVTAFEVDPATAPDPEERPDWWERAGEHALRRLLGADVDAIGRSLRSDPVVWLRGIDPGAAPGPTPYSGEAPVAAVATALLAVFGTVRLLGAAACAFLDENGGRIVRHVVAVPAARSAASSHGWRAELPWHMDGAYRPFAPLSGTPLAPPPRWLVFGVVKSDPSVPMTVSPLSDVAALLPAHHLAALARAEFAVSTPDSVQARREYAPLPVLDRDGEGRLVSRYNKGHCRGLTDRATAALEALDRTLAAPDLHLALDVRPGDVVVIDNWRCLHRRSAYAPAWDGNDRWLVRVYAAPHPLAADGRLLA